MSNSQRWISDANSANLLGNGFDEKLKLFPVLLNHSTGYYDIVRDGDARQVCMESLLTAGYSETETATILGILYEGHGAGWSFFWNWFSTGEDDKK